MLAFSLRDACQVRAKGTSQHIKKITLSLKFQPRNRTHQGLITYFFFSRPTPSLHRYYRVIFALIRTVSEMGDIFLSSVKFHRGILGHSCPAPDDVTSILRARCIAPLNVTRRNGRLFDRRRSRHVDTSAQSKRDKKKRKNTIRIPLINSLSPSYITGDN